MPEDSGSKHRIGLNIKIICSSELNTPTEQNNYLVPYYTDAHSFSTDTHTHMTFPPLIYALDKAIQIFSTATTFNVKLRG